MIASELQIVNQKDFQYAQLPKEECIRLYFKYRKYAVRSACKLLDQEAMDDFLQDLFVAFLERKIYYPVVEAKYFFTIINNFILSYVWAIKKKEKEEGITVMPVEQFDYAVENSDADGPIRQQDIAAALSLVIESLPEKQREVYLYTRRGDITYEQLGEKLGISMHTVRNHVTSAKEQIFRKLNALYSNSLYLPYNSL